MSAKNESSGKESVWDYPRPPKLEDSSRHIRIEFNGVVLAETERSVRVLETSLPPVYYIPPGDIEKEYLEKAGHTSFCEWKGQARYYDLVVNGNKAERAAWYYPDPTENFGKLKNYVAFYPQKVDACYLDDEKVKPQEGSFYGGWITEDIEGPFKGGPGTAGW